MSKTIVIDPVSRIEGHLKIEAVVEGGVVKEARSSGMLFRGLETILKGRDPRDAQRIMQRICGVCPTGHASAATLCLDDAFGIAGKIPDNGRIIRSLIQGANYIQSHVLHFYHLTALDFVDVAAAADYSGTDPALKMVRDFIGRGQLAPFLPRYEGDCLSCFIRRVWLPRMDEVRILVLCGDAWHPPEIVRQGLVPLAAAEVIFDWMEDARQWSPDVLAAYPLVILAKSDNVSAADKTNWMTDTAQAALSDYVQHGNGLFAIH